MPNAKIAFSPTTYARASFTRELHDAIEKIRLRRRCVNAFAEAFAACDELRPRSAALRDESAYLGTLLGLLVEEAAQPHPAAGRPDRHHAARRSAGRTTYLKS